MFRTSLLLLATLSASCIAADRPNVVLIVADDLGWADLGCYGSSYHKTPHLDRLAKDGVRFTQGYAACCVCSPSRAALLTGLHPARVGITDWLPGRPDRPDQRLKRPTLVNDLPTNLPNLASSLRKQGYATGHIGKWHLGGAGAGPRDRGFDVNFAGDVLGSPLNYFAPFTSKGRSMPGLEKATDGEYLTDRLAGEAEKFIEANKDRPFFLYQPHFAPHIPLKAPAEKIAKYKPRGPGQQGNPIYAAMLESLDEAVGRVLRKLDDLKIADRTIVIFTSDNGGLCTLEGPDTPATINAPFREGKGYLYEGGIRVPLIVRGPGFKAGHTTAAIATGMDVMPTLLSACGVADRPPTDGLDLTPALTGGTLPARVVPWHYPHYSNQGGKPSGAIRDGDLKLVEFFENGRLELFDVAKDPGENRNLAADRPADVERLAGKLKAWREAVGAKMPVPNPDFVPNPQGKDGIIHLHARSATVHGSMLRYEPLPHKTTLGYWVNEKDWADWEFTVVTPGKFVVEVHQGCGKGFGGSEVAVEVGKETLKFTVEDTGHFQNFKPRTIGTVTIEKPGRHTLAIKPIKKVSAAVMDVRQVYLRPETTR